MTAKERLLAMCAALEDDIGQHDDSGQYLLALETFIRELNIFPAYDTDVYKFVWTHKRSNNYFPINRGEVTTLVDTTSKLETALKYGTIDIALKPFCKTDLLKMGVTCFETEEEARAKLEEYKRWAAK